MMRLLAALCAACSLYGMTLPDPQDQWHQLIKESDQLIDQGSYLRAHNALKRALEVAETFGPQDARLAVTLNNLGGTSYLLGRLSEAERCYLRAIEIWRGQEPSSARAEEAQLIRGLAQIYEKEGKLRESEELLERAMRLRTERSQTDNFDYTYLLNTMASVRLRQGRPVEAESFAKDALERREKLLGPNHHSLIAPLSHWAMAAHALKRYDESDRLSRRAIDIAEKNLGPGHPALGTVLNNYAYLLRKSKRGKEAKPYAERAAAIMKEASRESGLGQTIDARSALALR